MQKKDLYKIVGKNIQKQRLIQGYTQETFAELMGVSWSYVSKIEAGILNLSLGKILEIADYLNIEVDLLLNTKS
ncbi:TPA: transcriptional regulator [Candidatus Gastranaerophilales bacterium HUM_13]|jgi:transcriptional regulator with XRE-family HTH domain|nr:helix-turn-helix transcriptional regulator [Acinetobacter sp.]DAB04596.1 MAG TPA: transcriptional regulator [Candidatus Gastranaerophilales bacterium HUM_13]